MDCQGLSLVSSIIAACAGLGGVFVGGVMLNWSQAKELRQARIREKLDKFYSPLLGIRMHILATSEVRQKLHSIAQAEWAALFRGIDSPGEKARIVETRDPEFKAIFEHSGGQVKEELVPLYNELVRLFTANMQFAEESTRKYFGDLVEFVELWNRQNKTPLPREVVIAINHNENKIYPLYADLETQFQALRRELDGN
jgi:hypothetical protein